MNTSYLHKKQNYNILKKLMDFWKFHNIIRILIFLKYHIKDLMTRCENIPIRKKLRLTLCKMKQNITFSTKQTLRERKVRNNKPPFEMGKMGRHCAVRERKNKKQKTIGV